MDAALTMRWFSRASVLKGVYTQDASHSLYGRFIWLLVCLCCLGHIGWFSGSCSQSVPATGLAGTC